MVFRRDSVPGTGLRSGHYYRHPKTSQERRQAVACPELTRPRRRMRYLPTYWSDLLRSDVLDRSWKCDKKRLRQWMR